MLFLYFHINFEIFIIAKSDVLNMHWYTKKRLIMFFISNTVYLKFRIDDFVYIYQNHQ